MAKAAPAVVIGADLNGLGVVRSLAHRRVPTILADTTRWRAAMWSRYGRGVVLKQLDGRDLIDGLLGLQKKLQAQPVLILADALAISAVSEYRDELIGAYRFQLPPRHIVAMLQNKARFHEFAEQHGLPVPRAIVVKTDTPFSVLSGLPFPVVVKSVTHNVRNPLGAKSAYFADTLEDAEAICRRLLESAEELIVQEWIDGPDSNICFSQFYLGQNPDGFKIFAGRKLASYPAKVGDAALCLPAAEVIDTLEPLIAKFLDLTEFKGQGGLEFKWDTRQRQFVIIGPKAGHTERQHEIATLSGINFPLAAYLDEIGQPPSPSTAINRTVAWRESAFLGSELPALSPGTHIYDGYWRLNDPLPGLFAYAHLANEWICRRLLKPARRWANPSDWRAALEKKYQILVKALFHRGKASTR